MVNGQASGLFRARHLDPTSRYCSTAALAQYVHGVASDLQAPRQTRLPTDSAPQSAQRVAGSAGHACLYSIAVLLCPGHTLLHGGLHQPSVVMGWGSLWCGPHVSLCPHLVWVPLCVG